MSAAASTGQRILVVSPYPPVRDGIGAYAVQQMRDKLVEHRQYIAAHGVDLPEIANWQWTGSTSAATSSER